MPNSIITLTNARCSLVAFVHILCFIGCNISFLHYEYFFLEVFYSYFVSFNSYPLLEIDLFNMYLVTAAEWFFLQNQNDVPINSTCAPTELSSVQTEFYFTIEEQYIVFQVLLIAYTGSIIGINFNVKDKLFSSNWFNNIT